MFRIKICGVTHVDDALLAAEAGADAIGLNFFPPSPRSIDHDQARQIVAAAPPALLKVGVFVNATVAELSRAYDDLGLDLLQLHGAEPATVLAALGERRAVKAFRCGPTGLSRLPRYLAQCRQLDCLPVGLLFDGFRPGSYGGTGASFDWKELDQVRSSLGDVRFAVAGGMRPDNVAKAIAAARPYAVDTASGVESSPGRKDPQLVRAFVAAANVAFAELPPRP